MTLGFALSFALFALMACAAFHGWSIHVALLDAEERTSSAAEHLVLEWKGDRTPEEAIQEVHEDARLDQVSMLLVDKHGAVVGSDGHPTLPWPKPRSGWVVHTLETDRGTVEAGMAWPPIDAEIRGRTLNLVLFALLATAVAGVATWAIVGRTLQPIGRLADGADAASANPFHAHLTAPSQDAEITHLVATLNGMLGRLRDEARNREQFYASAAHELRTPLSVLSAEIEVTLSRPRVIPEYVEALEDLQGQTRRLTGLTESLLTLNRLDVGTATEESERVDLADLAVRSIASLQGLIEARNLRVDIQLVEGQGEVVAPPSHAALVVRNLVENAVRYATPSSTVKVSVHDRLTVVNDFPAETSLDFERLSEPFVQGDASRSGLGNGLGLTLCRRIAQVNGWSLSLRQEGRRVIAEVAIPS